MTTITLKYPGTCRDCGETVLPGEQAEWDKVRGVSCCAAPGPVRMERITPETMEAYAISGDSLLYRETSYEAYAWMCPGCRLVWAKQHQAARCGERGHVTSFTETYGGTRWDGRGMAPALERGSYLAGTGDTYTRQAIRRESQGRAR
jgi:hypothetical protein